MLDNLIKLLERFVIAYEKNVEHNIKASGVSNTNLEEVESPAQNLKGNPLGKMIDPSPNVEEVKGEEVDILAAKPKPKSKSKGVKAKPEEGVVEEVTPKEVTPKEVIPKEFIPKEVPQEAKKRTAPSMEGVDPKEYFGRVIRPLIVRLSGEGKDVQERIRILLGTYNYEDEYGEMKKVAQAVKLLPEQYEDFVTKVLVIGDPFGVEAPDLNVGHVLV